MGNREERNEYATAKWDAEEVRRQASSEQRRHSDRRRQAKRNRTIIYLACVVLVSCLLAGIGWLLVNDVCSLNKPYTEVEITVEEGDSRGDVAKKLHDAGLVNSRLVFNIAGTFLHYNRYVEPGTYKLNSDMDFRALITNMHDWETDAKEAQGLIKVTIPEGYTVQQTLALLASKGVNTEEALTEAAKTASFTYDFIKDTGELSRLEGYLFPDTYEFYLNEKPASAIKRLLDNFNRKMTEERMQAVEESGYSLKEIITIASLIEKETDGTDHAKIASVIYNRLNDSGSHGTYKMLNIDAALLYALPDHEGALTNADKKVDSPYNLYTHAGLPPTPIANPGIASIDAALHPETTDYYYYALGKDGKHHFSTTLSEHNAFLASGNYGG